MKVLYNFIYEHMKSCLFLENEFGSSKSILALKITKSHGTVLSLFFVILNLTLKNN